MNSSKAAAETDHRDREDFYTRAAAEKLSPLWVAMNNLVGKEPLSPCVPAIWRYGDVRPYLAEAARLITTEEAERRVMVLEKQGRANGRRIKHSLGHQF